MTTLRVSHAPPLEQHLSQFEVDGATVQSALFADGRLMYPGRHDVEQTMAAAEPYTLWHEARVIEGFYGSVNRAIWLLSETATELLSGRDATLELLWKSHAAARKLGLAPSLDRLAAALVMIEHLRGWTRVGDPLDDAAIVLVKGMIAAGFPSSAVAFEEICDGAAPACVGLNIVEFAR